MFLGTFQFSAVGWEFRHHRGYGTVADLSLTVLRASRWHEDFDEFDFHGDPWDSMLHQLASAKDERCVLFHLNAPVANVFAVCGVCCSVALSSIGGGLQQQGEGCDGRPVQVSQVIRASRNVFSSFLEVSGSPCVFLLCVEEEEASLARHQRGRRCAQRTDERALVTRCGVQLLLEAWGHDALIPKPRKGGRNIVGYSAKKNDQKFKSKHLKLHTFRFV